MKILHLLVLLAPGLLSIAHGSGWSTDPLCADGQMFCMQSSKCSNKEEDDVEINGFAECAAQLQIRPYSATKALVRLRTNETSIKFFLPLDNEVFGCEQTEGDLIRETKGRKLITSEKWESGIVCDFYYESDPLFKRDDFSVKYGVAEMKGIPAIFSFLDHFGPRCDPDWIPYEPTPSEEWIFEEPDRRFNKIDCPAGTELAYDLGAAAGNGSTAAAASILCAETVLKSKIWRYAITPKGTKQAPILVLGPDSKRRVACRRAVCAQCADDVPPCSPLTANCTSPTVAHSGACKILKCPSNRIQVNARNATIGAATCVGQRHEKGTTAFKWSFDGELVETVSCAASVHCQDVHPLRVDCSEGCAGIDLYSGNVTCASGPVIIASDGDTVKIQTIQCNQKTGRWRALDDDGAPYNATVPVGAALSCEAPPVDKKPVEASSGGVMIGVVVGVLVLVIVAVIFFCLVRKRYCKKPKQSKNAKSTKSGRGSAPAANTTTEKSTPSAPSNKEDSTPEPRKEIANETSKKEEKPKKEDLPKTDETPKTEDLPVTEETPKTEDSKKEEAPKPAPKKKVVRPNIQDMPDDPRDWDSVSNGSKKQKSELKTPDKPAARIPDEVKK